VTRFPACMPLLSVSLCLVQWCAAQSPAAVPTLKAKAKIVVIDVVVTDKQAKPVKELQASDFTVAENGAPQTISHFEAHTSLSAEDTAKIAAMPKLEPNIFTNYSPVPANGPLTVLVFDALNTKMNYQAVVLQQMQKYLATPHPGVRMELFVFNTELRLLQGFTFDQGLLRAALANRKSAPQASMLTNRPLSNDTGISRVASNYGQMKGADVQPGDPIDYPDLAAIQLLDRQLSTLQAMNALARYMGGLPGRKNLLWFSASFPISLVSPGIAAKLHETMALLARNQVAVYPIGAGGFDGGCRAASVACPTDTMKTMAEDTGGKVFAGSNDIAAEVEQAVDHGSNYYTLTYTPANHDWKGEFRKVDVKLAQKGYTLAYRPGYYAEDVDKTDRKVEAKADEVAATPDPAVAALHAAMEYGSPQPSDIVLKVAVNPATGRPEDVVAKANNMAPKISGPFERYVLQVAALPAAFTFARDVPGKIHMSARLVTRVYSADGALINSTTLNVIGDIDDARYRTIMADGVQFRQEVSVPVKGENFLRIGVEDLATNRMGVVEIPVATVAKLKPLAGDAVSQK
jgi:VWFA-related protein